MPIIPVINNIPTGVDKAINTRIINIKQIDTDIQIGMFIEISSLSLYYNFIITPEKRR
jgi:hypothetical protein